MKSSLDTRRRFKERIEDALKLIQDSDELTEALAIVDDLDEILEITALSAEYFYHKNLAHCDYDYDDDYGYNHMHDGYNIKKMYEYLIHRLDLFFGIGVHGGVWKNSQHWIAVTVERLKKLADTAGMGFMGKPQAPVSNPYSNPSPYNPIIFPNPYAAPPAPVAPTPPASMYIANLQSILKKATNNQLNLISVTHKTNGDFELVTPKATIYLTHSFVPGTVTIKDSNHKKLKVYKESDLDWIADYIKGLLL